MRSMSFSTTRRNLLRGGAMMMASSFLSKYATAFAADTPSSPPSPVRLGIASYTFRKFDQPHLIDFMKQLKTPYLNLKDTHLPMTPVDQIAPRAAEYRAAGRTLTAAGTIYFPKDEDEDIRVGIHNHAPEDKQWPSPLDVLAAVKNMDPRMGCCIDVGHTMRSGTDVVAAIRKAGPRLFDIHMKDLADGSKKDSQVAVGDGIMPVRSIFQAL